MRLSIVAAALCLTATNATAATQCSAERYVFGNHNFPSHEEALVQCQREEAEMTNAETGTYERAGGCHDIGETSQHEGWTYGRVALDVVARDSGDPYTFEGLWMCKPVAE
ncbi:hypothetical protein [Luteibacter aegosomatissinici]|uniref:hypothetical protein n=1 Tax=Luteibacter aegosomatissinici TaxID=2911539 RepID=UPI001FFA2CA9|nr:hypothetical protein [Luteibacter aegosomatissinici]UPG94420.1 hypothetical protein L2Y97_21810 [Luteibacter aegosomatissinici]